MLDADPHRGLGPVASLGLFSQGFLRGAIDVERTALDQLAQFSPTWIDFSRPLRAGSLQEVSIDLQYEEGSNTRINAFLSARDIQGRVFHRTFEGPSHDRLLDPAAWSDWQDFLNQP